MSGWLQNIRIAIRMMRRNPGFSAMVVLIMALGIGANTAIFSVVHAVLLQPLPFGDVDRVVQIWHTPPQASFPGMTRFSVSAGNFIDWQRQNHVFEGMALSNIRRNRDELCCPTPADFTSLASWQAIPSCSGCRSAFAGPHTGS